MSFSSLGIIKDENSKTGEALNEACPDLLTRNYSKVSELVDYAWKAYKKLGEMEKSTNGKVFEAIIAVALYREEVHPIFVETSITFVPNVTFDFVLYEKTTGPVVLSAKTSLRERYKQADLEGMFLRQVHRRAKSYLITLDAPAAKGVNEKISAGDVLGLDKVVLADTPEFDELMVELKKGTYISPPQIDVLKSQRVIG